jgi:hypothetical protein
MIKLIVHLDSPHIFFVSFVTKISNRIKFNLNNFKDNKIFKSINYKKSINFEQ